MAVKVLLQVLLSIFLNKINGFPLNYNPYGVSDTTDNSAVVEYHLQFTQAFHQPDGMRRQSILINGQFPGPTIRVRTGQTLLLHIDNQLFYEGLTIHIHGLHNNGTPEMDGVAFGTQRPIPAGHQFTYRHLITNTAGTYWYHSHYQLQSHSVFGAFIIDESDDVIMNTTAIAKTKEEEEDMILLLSDWFHQTDEEQMIGLLSSQFKWIGNPESLLINGQGRFNCSLSKDSTLQASCLAAAVPYPVVSIANNGNPNGNGSAYRLRVIGATSLSYMSLRIARHRMRIIEVDGMMVKPLAAVEELEVNSGQRYSVLLERTNSYATNETVFRIDVGVRWRPSGPTGIGLLQYKSGNLTADSQALVAAMSSLPLYPPNSASNPPSQPDWVLSQLRPHGPHYQPPPAQSTRAIILTGRQANVSLPVAHNKHTAINETTNYHIKWIINDQYWMPPMDGSLLEQLMFAETDFTTADKSPLVFTIELNQVIDIVLQNTVALNGLCEQHPWHLHGHHFWDYGGGPGLYDPVLGAQLTANNSEPIMRDTTTLYPYQSAYFQPQILPPGSPCGWRLLRFRADNPGLWNMHCHIAAHMHMGMQVFFLEAPLTLRYLMRSQSIGPDGQWNP